MFPAKNRYMSDAKKYSLIPVFKTIPADFETPISIFKKVKANFLLESVESGDNVGRYSILAIGEKSRIELNDTKIKITEYQNGNKAKTTEDKIRNPLLKIREYFASFKTPEYENLPPFFGGAIGYLGYETVQYFEEIPIAKNTAGIPDGILIIPEVVLVYDSIKRSVLIIVSTTPNSSPETEYESAARQIEEIAKMIAAPQVAIKEKRPDKKTSEPVSNMTKLEFEKAVEKAIKYIVEGDIIQVVPSRSYTVENNTDPFEIYRSLRIINPSPYLFYLDFEDFQIIGSSPEVMVKLQNREVLLKPIAGTRKRGNSITEDNNLAEELLNDEKERAEHLMLVDLGRNDLGKVAVSGSVEVSDYMTIERYSHVMHLVSTIKAELNTKYDVFDLIEATFPAGTVTGAPKIRAMEIIAEIEKNRRGPYAGMILYLSFNGNFDSCITIRTIVLKQGKATVQAGAGIVSDSVPEYEFYETEKKTNALMQALRESAKEVGK